MDNILHACWYIEEQKNLIAPAVLRMVHWLLKSTLRALSHSKGGASTTYFDKKKHGIITRNLTAVFTLKKLV